MSNSQTWIIMVMSRFVALPLVLLLSLNSVASSSVADIFEEKRLEEREYKLYKRKVIFTLASVVIGYSGLSVLVSAGNYLYGDDALKRKQVSGSDADDKAKADKAKADKAKADKAESDKAKADKALSDFMKRNKIKLVFDDSAQQTVLCVGEQKLYPSYRENSSQLVRAPGFKEVTHPYGGATTYAFSNEKHGVTIVRDGNPFLSLGKDTLLIQSKP